MMSKSQQEASWASYDGSNASPDDRPSDWSDHDVFGHEDNHDIKYKTLSWQIVAVLMIAEIISNGMLSLPSSLATVGMAPGLILIIFLGMSGYNCGVLTISAIRSSTVEHQG